MAAQFAWAVCSFGRFDSPKTATDCNAAVADESADWSCWAAYAAAGKGLNLNSRVFHRGARRTGRPYYPVTIQGAD
jgi:hypothetical protein